MEKSTKGSPSTDIICKYGRHTKILKLKVWVPELPLEIELSDAKLGQVTGWKVGTGVHANVIAGNSNVTNGANTSSSSSSSSSTPRR